MLSERLSGTLPPDSMVTTPESVHLMLATKKYERYLRNVQLVVVDEWQ